MRMIYDVQSCPKKRGRTVANDVIAHVPNERCDGIFVGRFGSFEPSVVASMPEHFREIIPCDIVDGGALAVDQSDVGPSSSGRPRSGPPFDSSID